MIEELDIDSLTPPSQQKARAKERRAELKAERDAIEAEERAAEEAAAAAAAARAAASQYAAMLPDPNGAVDDPWWMDCELCGLAGWNVVRLFFPPFPCLTRR